MAKALLWTRALRCRATWLPGYLSPVLPRAHFAHYDAVLARNG